MTKKLIAPFAVSLMLAGCTTDVQNLTATTVPRNNTGLYPVEVIVNRGGRGIDNDSIQTSLVVGQQEFPMLRPDIRSNRWEFLLPVPDNMQDVFYYFKVNYDIDYPTKWEQKRGRVYPQTAPKEQFKLRLVGNPPPVIAAPIAGPAPSAIPLDLRPLASNVQVEPASLTLTRGSAADLKIIVPKAAPAVSGLLLTVRTDNERSVSVPKKAIVPSQTKTGVVRVQALGVGEGNIAVDVEKYGRVLVPFTVVESGAVK